MSVIHNSALLALLQLVSPALPVGAYSYSEGLETLVEQGVIANSVQLQAWLEQELRCGTVRLEAAIMVRAQNSFCSDDLKALAAWNAWLSAARETLELRQQSWQMGQSLLKLLVNLQPQLQSVKAAIDPCNWAVAFGIAAAAWQIDSQAAVIGYLQSWTTNLVNAGVKLIPLGQTAGQQLLFGSQGLLIETTQSILDWENEQLGSCGWGLALASMAHETQYTRLFRS